MFSKLNSNLNPILDYLLSLDKKLDINNKITLEIDDHTYYMLSPELESPILDVIKDLIRLEYKIY